MSTVLIDTTDLGEAEEILSANYTRMRFGAPAGVTTHTRVLRSQVGSLMIDDLKYSYDMRFDTEPMADIVLCRVHSGTIEQRFPDGQVEMSGPGTVTAMTAHDGMPLSGQVRHAHYDALTLDRGLLSQVAAGSPRRCRDGPTPVQLTASMPISQAANNHLVEAIDYVHRDIMTNPHATQNPLIAGAVARYLAASTLGAYPNTALLEPTIEDRLDTTPALLRRAIAFIEDNGHTDISIADIANHVCVTPRSVQLMFRRHRDSTPMEYLRRVRLHYAHQELLRSDRRRTTVTQIAAKWGFAHTGRFAVYYRDAYGRSPHVTLRELL
jgi:AraC-like DNA-binding protein